MMDREWQVIGVVPLDLAKEFVEEVHRVLPRSEVGFLVNLGSSFDDSSTDLPDDDCDAYLRVRPALSTLQAVSVRSVLDTVARRHLLI